MENKEEHQEPKNPLLELENSVFVIENKLEKILGILEKQETRAKWAVFWKLFWVLVLIIVPMYLSYRIFSNVDFSFLKGASENLKEVGKLRNSSSSFNLGTIIDIFNK